MLNSNLILKVNKFRSLAVGNELEVELIVILIVIGDWNIMQFIVFSRTLHFSDINSLITRLPSSKLIIIIIIIVILIVILIAIIILTDGFV